MNKSKRADILLVERGFFESRARAQDAIEAGLVSADGAKVAKASAKISLEARLQASASHPYVSRGGVKLAAALDRFGFDPRGRVCLDVGASTGGFSQVLLERGARRVVAVDVGHGQLHRELHGEPRLVSLEGQDIRSLDPQAIGEAPSLATIDVSFISLALVLGPVTRLVAGEALLVALIKPQFEVGRAHLKHGLVRDEGLYETVCARVEAELAELGWEVAGLMPSPIAGGDGNRELLIGARRG